MTREKVLRESILHEKLVCKEEMNTVAQCHRAQSGTYLSLMGSLKVDFTMRDWDLKNILEGCSMVNRVST